MSARMLIAELHVLFPYLTKRDGGGIMDISGVAEIIAA